MRISQDVVTLYQLPEIPAVRTPHVIFLDPAEIPRIHTPKDVSRDEAEVLSRPSVNVAVTRHVGTSAVLKFVPQCERAS
jgi:hypothetical protein